GARAGARPASPGDPRRVPGSLRRAGGEDPDGGPRARPRDGGALGPRDRRAPRADLLPLQRRARGAVFAAGPSPAEAPAPGLLVPLRLLLRAPRPPPLPARPRERDPAGGDPLHPPTPGRRSHRPPAEPAARHPPRRPRPLRPARPSLASRRPRGAAPPRRRRSRPLPSARRGLSRLLRPLSRRRRRGPRSPFAP